MLPTSLCLCCCNQCCSRGASWGNRRIDLNIVQSKCQKLVNWGDRKCYWWKCFWIMSFRGRGDRRLTILLILLRKCGVECRKMKHLFSCSYCHWMFFFFSLLRWFPLLIYHLLALLVYICQLQKGLITWISSQFTRQRFTQSCVEVLRQ